MTGVPLTLDLPSDAELDEQGLDALAELLVSAHLAKAAEAAA
jgi:hypothetical protein